MSTVIKTHISTSGERVPCNAIKKACPRGGHETTVVGGKKEQGFQAAALRANQATVETPSHFPWMKDIDTHGPDANTFPLNEKTVGTLITDRAHIARISRYRNEYLNGYETGYLASEEGLCFKQHDEYFTEVAVIGEDSHPLLATSFDVYEDREAVIERVSFLGRYSILNDPYTKELTKEDLAQGDALYQSFKDNGGDKRTDVLLLNQVYRYALTTGNPPADYYKKYETNENAERLRRSGKKSFNPSMEEREFALKVVADALGK